MKTTTCACGVVFEYEPIYALDREIFSNRKCESCSENLLQSKLHEQAQSNLQSKILEWRSICPPDFDKCDPDKLPNPWLLPKAMEWKYGPIGLLLSGGSDAGKTRVAWQVLKREHFMGRKVASVNAMSLSQYAMNLSRNPDSASEWSENIYRCQILLADDIFKSKMTDRVEEFVFNIFDHFGNYMKPIILTVNGSRHDLSKRLSAERCHPILTRILRNLKPVSQ